VSAVFLHLFKGIPSTLFLTLSPNKTTSIEKTPPSSPNLIPLFWRNKGIRFFAWWSPVLLRLFLNENKVLAFNHAPRCCGIAFPAELESRAEARFFCTSPQPSRQIGTGASKEGKRLREVKPLPRPLPTREGSSAKRKDFAIPQKGISSRSGTPPLPVERACPDVSGGLGGEV
jgi:hypothetical protein